MAHQAAKLPEDKRKEYLDGLMSLNTKSTGYPGKILSSIYMFRGKSDEFDSTKRRTEIYKREDRYYEKDIHHRRNQKQCI